MKIQKLCKFSMSILNDSWSNDFHHGLIVDLQRPRLHAMQLTGPYVSRYDCRGQSGQGNHGHMWGTCGLKSSDVGELAVLAI